MTDGNQCDAIIAIRPERQGGVLMRCTLAEGHEGSHEHRGTAEGYPLVENTADFAISVRWDR